MGYDAVGKKHNPLLETSNSSKGIHPSPQPLTNCIFQTPTLKHTYTNKHSLLPELKNLTRRKLASPNWKLHLILAIHRPSLHISSKDSTKHSKLSNIECRSFHEECKTKLIIYKQQTTQKNRKHKDRNAFKAS
jgi:hypothetical protein